MSATAPINDLPAAPSVAGGGYDPRSVFKTVTLKKYGYLVFLLPALLPVIGSAFGQLSGLPALFAWWTPFVVFGLVPIIDHLIGEDATNPTDEEVGELDEDWFYQLITAAVVPVQIASLLFCGAKFLAAASWPEALGYVVSCGIVSGATTITAAHELIHKTNRWEPMVGGALLATVWYATFKPEHLYGHHRMVATPKDNSTALKGESSGRFILRAMRNNPRDGYALAAERMRRKKLSPWHYKNEMIWWTALSLALTGLSFALGGAAGVVFFLGQAFFAVALLEVINYIEHYGLMRAEVSPGRYERVTPQHSWNANHLFTNWLLFQLQRHSDHHANGARRYQTLRHFDDSPQLPFGYGGAVVAAAIPPLWKRIMDPRVDAYVAARTRAAGG